MPQAACRSLRLAEVLPRRAPKAIARQSVAAALGRPSPRQGALIPEASDVAILDALRGPSGAAAAGAGPGMP